MQETFYTIPEVAAMLKISKTKVRQLINSGELTSVRVGFQLRITQSALDAYVRRQTQR